MSVVDALAWFVVLVVVAEFLSLSWPVRDFGEADGDWLDDGQEFVRS